MEKDTPHGLQYKVLLKPTDVGLLVMKRMQRPHLDKSAELRRFIELGYAAEQAGFILDGTVLRHAGRAWDTQPSFGVQRQEDVGAEPFWPTAARDLRSQASPQGELASSGGSPQAAAASSKSDEGSGSSLLHSLRRLSS